VLIDSALVGYAAVILSFLGAVHWGLCRLMDANLLRMYAPTPAWYQSLRSRLTLGAVVALLIALPSAF
jgi:hypothetical protein